MFGSKQSLGIDLRDNYIRLAHLSSSAGQIKLLNYLSAPLPPSQEHLSDYETTVIKSLSNFITNNQVNAEQIIIGIPQKEIMFRKIEVPAVKTDEIRQILEFEIERHVPFPLDEIYFDFKIIGPKGDSHLEIALVATKQDRVNYLLSLLEKAHVEYTKVELSTFALFTAVNFLDNQADNDKNYMTLDIGLNEIEVSVAQKGQFVFSHKIAKQIRFIDYMPTVESPPEEVEQAPIILAKESRALAEKLKKEINFLITSLQKTHRETTINQIFIGGLDAYPSIAEHLKETSQIETILLDPVQNINIADSFDKDITGADVVIGLALEGLNATGQGFNLMSPEEQAVQKKTHSLVAPIVLGIIVILLAIGNGASYLLRERSQLMQIEEKISEIKPKVAAAEKLAQRYKKLQEQKKNLETLSRQPISLLEVLKELTTKLPSDVWLERFKMDKQEIEIGGFAKTASNLIPLLEDSFLFKDVKFSSPITSKRGQEHFNIKITLEQ